MQADTPLSGPGLRLHLVELFAKENDINAVIAMAREAESFILGSAASARIPEISTETLAAGILAESERAAKLEAEISEPFSDDEASPPPPIGKTAWTPARVSELERLIAAGLTYAEMAKRMGYNSAGALAAEARKHGFTHRYPRVPGGRLLYKPYPLDLPWPPPSEHQPGVLIDLPAAAPPSARNTRAQRKCLKCGKPFSSESAGNRICKACTPAVNAAYEPVSAKVGP